MTAALAAIWLADREELLEVAAAAAAAAAAWLDWAMLSWDRFEVDVDGRVESKRPCVAECFLEWPLSSGAADRLGVTSRAPAAAAGREKLRWWWCCCCCGWGCRLAELVELANWLYIGVAGESTRCCCWCRVLETPRAEEAAALLSSLPEESMRKGGGRGGPDG